VIAKYQCSVTKNLKIVKAGPKEYHELSVFHYREPSLSPHNAIYAIKDMHPGRRRLGSDVGVIVYTMPIANLELRNIATCGMFEGFGQRRLQLQMVNSHIRSISRVIIDPRYRGLGLAARLVRETMPKLNTPIIESLAVMGQINPFFEKAGMKPYFGKTPPRNVKLTEAFGMIGIEDNDFVDAKAVQQKLEKLNAAEAKFIDRQIKIFLQAYGKRRNMPGGIDRIRYVLSKLTARPVYYIWFNHDSKPIKTMKGRK